jgi:hypothetical protein
MIPCAELGHGATLYSAQLWGDVSYPLPAQQRRSEKRSTALGVNPPPTAPQVSSKQKNLRTYFFIASQ